MFVDWELTLLENIRRTLEADWLDFVMTGISTLGNGGAIWVTLAIGLLIFQKTRLAGLTVSLSLCLSSVICNLALKPAIERLRPCDISDRVSEIITCPNDFSFPSGHTSAAFAAATAIMIFFPRYGLVAIGFACLMALSRLYLFVHFPSDVVFGVLLGATCALTAYGAIYFLRTVLLTKN